MEAMPPLRDREMDRRHEETWMSQSSARFALVALGAVASLAACGAPGTGGTGAGASSSTGSMATGGGAPRALVYRGPASCQGCAEAVAALLQTSKHGFDVAYVGPGEPLGLTDEALAGASLYAQPGGGGTVADAFATMTGDTARVRAFVEGGGLYLGFCMGGYFAGANPGFMMLPGDTGGYITSPGASVTNEMDTVIGVVWRGQPRWMYFQDGPYFILAPGAAGVTVLATYASNGEIAAMTAPFGKGRIGVVGPHPEATLDWYQQYGLTDPDGLDADLGHDLIDAVMP